VNHFMNEETKPKRMVEVELEFSEGEFATIEAVAAAEGLSIDDLVRRVTREEVIRFLRS
jgi:hypothetical protein